MPKAGTVPFALLASALAAVAHAGPLAPPPGPIAPSMKTLEQVEPRIPIGPDTTPGDPANSTYRITQPGSYYLTEDLVGEVDKIGILIEASDVTVDLRGFTLTGQPAVSLAWPAIYANFGRTNISVHDGTVVGWSGGGVFLDPDPLFDPGTARGEVRRLRVRDCGGDGIRCEQNSIVEDCVVAGCDGYGIRLTRDGGRVSRCLVIGSSLTGILTNIDSVVEMCTARENGTGGIGVGSRSVVVGCTAENNGGPGSAGISVGIGCSVRDCVSSSNNDQGLRIAGDSTVTGCVSRNNGGEGYVDQTGVGSFEGIVFDKCIAYQNGEEGFNLQQSAQLSACIANQNTLCGFLVEDGSTLTRCTSTDNAQCGITALDALRLSGCVVAGNGTGGVIAGQYCSVEGTLVRANMGDGLELGAGATVRNCEIISNTGNGIDGSSGMLIDACTVELNGLRGIDGTEDCRILNCLVRDNVDSGIHVSSYAYISGNQVITNGGDVGEAGIRVFEGCRVESNMLKGNFRGVRMDDNRNVVVRNTFILNGGPQLEDVNMNNQNAPAPVTLLGADSWANIEH